MSSLAGVVGRDTELAVLESLFTEVLRGRGRALLIEGEAGIGKTTVLSAALETAKAAGCEVVWGTSDELRQRFPLLAVTQALGVNEHSPDPRRARVAAALAQPASARSRSVGVAAGDPVLAAVEQLLELVDLLCADGPMVFVLEDVHWADDASLVFLQRLCRATSQMPLVVVGTRRPVPRRSEVARFRREVRARGGVLLSLQGLSKQSMLTMAETLVGGVPGPRLAERLDSTAGNPFYARELLGVLSRSEVLHVEDGIVEIPATATLGDGVLGGRVSMAEVITDQLDFLSGDALKVLRTAALLGEEFSVTDLAAIVGRTPTAVAVVIEEAMVAGVVEAVGPWLRFRHSLIRQTLYDGVSEAVRTAVHRHAAQVLIEAGASVERVAGLILSALDTADGWEIDWLVAHAETLVGRAPAVAVELLEHALRHLSVDDSRYPTLVDQLAMVSFMMRHHERTEHITRAILARGKDPDRVSHAAWLLGYSLMRTGRSEDALREVTEVVARLNAAPAQRGLHEALRAMLLAHVGRTEQAAEAATHAIAVGRELDEVNVIAYALHAQSMVSLMRGDTTGALRHIGDALQIVWNDNQFTDFRLMLAGNQVGLLQDLDRFAEASTAARNALALAERTGSPRLAFLRQQTGELAYWQGRWDDAMAEFEAAPDSEPSDLTIRRYAFMALIAGHCDNGRQASAHLRTLEQMTNASTFTWGGPVDVFTSVASAARSLAGERAGLPERAITALTSALPPNSEERPSDLHETVLPVLVRLALAADDEPMARLAAKKCQQQADREGLAKQQAAADWCRGLLDEDPAVVLAAAGYFRTAGRKLNAGNALEDAAVLHARGGDTAAARAVLGEVLEVYGELGATWDARRATSRLRPYGVRLGVRGPRRRPQTGWQALTATELRVARLVADGRPNPDIAARLQMSRRTVESHVSHILTKLKVTSRHEIRDIAESDV